MRSASTWKRQRTAAAILTLLWLASIVVGYFGFRCDGVMTPGQELSRDRSLFLSANAATLTGFQQTIGVNEFNPESSRGPILALGLIIGGTFLNLMVGGFAVVRIAGLAYQSRHIVIYAIMFWLLATLAGAAALIGPGRTLLSAIFQSAAAFGNCGLAMDETPGIMKWSAWGLIVLIFLGGLGLPVLMDFYDTIGSKRPISSFSRSTVQMAAAIYLIGFFALFFFQRPADWSGPWSAWQQAVATSSFESLNSRTAGLHVEMVDTLTQPAIWVLMVLMAVGGSFGGAAGGINSNALLQLGRGTRDVLHGRGVPRAFGIALLRVAVYVAIVFIGLLAMFCFNDSIAADRLLFIVVSAASNVGLSHDPISRVGPSLIILTVIMVLGRIVGLGALWWMAEAAGENQKSDIVS